MQRYKNLSKFWAELKTKQKHKAPWHRVKLLETEARGYYNQPEIQYGQGSSSLVSALDLGLGFTVVQCVSDAALTCAKSRAGCTGFPAPRSALRGPCTYTQASEGALAGPQWEHFHCDPIQFCCGVTLGWPLTLALVCLHPCAWSLGLRVQACLDAELWFVSGRRVFLLQW